VAAPVLGRQRQVDQGLDRPVGTAARRSTQTARQPAVRQR
jgi:hypothetical protein